MIRIAIIGTGVMGADHAQIVSQELSGAKLQVVCDTDEGRARSVADSCGGADIASNPEATIARTDVDAVIIASPDSTHAPLVQTCIQAGKPVLCEKPLSPSSAQCLAIIEAEQASGSRRVMLGFMRRYDRSYLPMLQARQDGALGRALMMHNFHRNVDAPIADFSGAMAITNSAPHEFDIARFVLGTEYKTITAYQARRSDGLVAPVIMVLETTHDQLVSIEINNNAAYGYDVRAELVCEQGSIASNNIAYTRTDARLAATTSYDADWRARYHEAYVRQSRDFLAWVATGDFPEIASDSWDGYCASVVAETGVTALATGQKQAVVMIAKPDLHA